MPLIATSAATAAFSASTGAYTLFKYNRANYLFDAGLRYNRFCSGFNMAIAQASMYREDIRDLTDLTVSKQDLFHVVGVIFFVLTFQLIMAGRLGVHGPAPPGWLLGMYWGNVCTALLFLALSTWLAMHASARATSGSAHMLTHSVRLPIPSAKQLDKARKTGNTFEQQAATDMFRVPFLIRPSKKTDMEDSPDSDNGFQDSTGKTNFGKSSSSSKSKAMGSDRRIPNWWREELRDLHSGKGGVPPGPGSPPEHFEKYRHLQQEWWGHDVYARLSMLYFFSYWLHAASLYTQCHCFGELRALWPAWSCTMVFVAAHYAILRVDIVDERLQQSFSLPMERVAPLTALLCCLGMTLDYSIIKPSTAWRAVIYAISYLAYAIHFLWAVRMYELAQPQQQQGERKEVAGHAWWPSEWPLPPAFQHALYLVAPPKHLEPWQTCLQMEMKAASRGKTIAPSGPSRQREEQGTFFFAWKIFRGGLISTIALWIFIIFGRIFENFNGERQLLKQEGRVERWPSHIQPWMPPGSRHGSRNEWCHTGGCDRRLSARGAASADAMAMAQRLSVAVGPLAQALEGKAPTRAPAGPAAPSFEPLKQVSSVELMGLDQPKLLACRADGAAAALSVTRDGVLTWLPAQEAVSAEDNQGLSRFTLDGIDGVENLIGASWGETGLLVVAKNGVLAECPGVPLQGGQWSCQILSAKLPLGGTALQAGVASRIPGGDGLRAAVVFEGESSIVLLELDIASASSWVPVGEVQIPQKKAQVQALSATAGSEAFLLFLKDGAAFSWAVGGEDVNKIPVPQVTASNAMLSWQGACQLSKTNFAHLAWQEHTTDLRPELFVSSTLAKM